MTFVRGDAPTHERELTSNYTRLIDELSLGDRVMLADGMISMQVVEKLKDSVRCEIAVKGTIRSKQGINLPGTSLSVSSMRPEDVDNALWAARNNIDFISLSFVRTAQDVLSLKKSFGFDGCLCSRDCKNRKTRALDELEAIVDAADGVMVARGDLGVEIDVADTPVAQKKIIRICREKLKPVIVATQMLESMHHNRRPTRAEASDVANAILDGADACMLSGETAIGDYPVLAVETMNRIMIRTEVLLKSQPVESKTRFSSRVHPVTSAVTHNAANIAEAIDAKLVVVVSHTGGTAWVKSQATELIYRRWGYCDSDAVLRRMTLFWGIMPHHVENLENPEKLIEKVTQWGVARGMLVPGDRVVYVTGTACLSTHTICLLCMRCLRSSRNEGKTRSLIPTTIQTNMRRFF